MQYEQWWIDWWGKKTPEEQWVEFCSVYAKASEAAEHANKLAMKVGAAQIALDHSKKEIRLAQWWIDNPGK